MVAATRCVAATVSAWRSGVFGFDERGARHVQAHHLHEHLVGIGGAVERAGAGVVVRAHLRGQQFVARGQAFGVALAHLGLLLVGDVPVGMGPPGTKMMGIWPNDAAPMNRPGTILSQMPNNNAPNRRLRGESATAVASAITSRLNSDSSMPARPCVTPSHMAGTPPATCAVAPATRAAARITSG